VSWDSSLACHLPDGDQMERIRPVWRWIAIPLLAWGTFGAGVVTALRAEPSPSQKRIALLIGNEEYPLAKDQRSGPVRDVGTIRSALIDLQFVGVAGDVRPRVKANQKREAMLDQLREFKADLTRAGPGAIGFFYYAGHGSADPAGRENYLLGVDVTDVERADVKQQGIAITDIVKDLGQAQTDGAPLIIVVIDACRNSPLTKRVMTREGILVGPKMAGPGKSPSKGILLALSTGAGQAASDSDEYARALAKALSLRGMTIQERFEWLTTEMRERTGGSQVPAFVSGIGKDVCLGPCETAPPQDPRKELVGIGVLWTVDAFFDAVRRGDQRVVKLFLAGHMATDSPNSQGQRLPVILALNKSSPAKMLDLLVAGGVDVNATYEVWAPMGPHHKTLLDRAIEEGNLALVKALVDHKVEMNRPMETYAAMGLTRGTFPLAAAFSYQRFDIAQVLINAGADPRVGGYAAYSEAQDLIGKNPGLAQTLQPMLQRIAPQGADRARVDGRLRLQAIDKRLNELGLAIIKAVPYSGRQAELQREYDALQIEKRDLRAQLGLPPR
jgi:uncharacterized caspase-like protein